jgi:hypothetical protein
VKKLINGFYLLRGIGSACLLSISESGVCDYELLCRLNGNILSVKVNPGRFYIGKKSLKRTGSSLSLRG